MSKPKLTKSCRAEEEEDVVKWTPCTKQISNKKLSVYTCILCKYGGRVRLGPAADHSPPASATVM